VIIMDEPTIGLDPHQILIVRDLISSLRGRMTEIISSHILPEIEMTCDRVLIINRGQVVAQGTPAALRREFIGQSRYDIELSGDLSLLPGVLQGVDPSLRIEPPAEPAPSRAMTDNAPDPATFQQIQLTTDREDDLGEPLLQALAGDRRFRLRSLTRSHPSLEDVFLVATQRSWDVVDAKAPQKR